MSIKVDIENIDFCFRKSLILFFLHCHGFDKH